MNPDDFRVEVGRYKDRWYLDPLPADERWSEMKDPVPSVSTIKQAWPKFLTDWAGTQAAEYAYDNHAAWSKLDRDAAVALIASASSRTRDRAADRGSAIHGIIEGIAKGQEPMTALIPDAVPFLPAARAFIADAKPEWVLSEFVVIRRDGWGGTADGAVRIDGKLYLVDYKTKASVAKKAYDDEGAQAGAYLAADYYIGEDMQRHELPQFDGALIVVIAPDGYKAHTVNVEPACDAFFALHEFWKAKGGQIIGKPMLFTKAPTQAERTIAAIGAVMDERVPNKQQTTAYLAAVRQQLRERLLERIDAIRQNPAALQSLAARWSIDLADVPTMKSDHDHNSAELGRILAVVQAVEDEHRMPFATEVPGPDEGGRISDADFDETAAALAALDDGGKTLVKLIVDQAKEAGRIVSVSVLRSKRRLSIARALITCAAEGMDEAHIRALLALVVGDMQDSITTGAYVGALTMADADRFAQLAQAFAAGQMVATYSDDSRPVLALAS